MRPYIAFRKRFILPIKYLLEEIGLLSRVTYPDRGELLTRIDGYRSELIKLEQKKLRDEIKLVEARIEELTWVAYGSSEKKEC